MTETIARLVGPGNAAKMMPSMTKTRPRATTKSDMEDGAPASARRRRGGRRRAPACSLLAGGIVEVAEEIRIGFEQEPGVVRLEPCLIGLHRAIEGEEIRIAAESVGEDLVACRVALAAQLLGLGLRIGDHYGDVAVGIGADLLRLLIALGAELGGLALPVGLHALIDGLAVLLGEV